MDNRTKFYCWIIGKLERKRMTLEEIANEWRYASNNSGDKALTDRSFHRYRDEIREQFGLEIRCDKHDGYSYYIKRDEFGSNEITDWMLSALRIASLGNMLKYHKKVMLEQSPLNTEYLDDILSAIDKHYTLKFHYRTPWGIEKDMELAPAFVRLFHQRWYVIGALTENEYIRTLPFDRIEYMQVVCKRHELSDATQQLLTPETFYEDCFGVMRMEDVKPERIRIRAFYPEYRYIDEVPLHISQTKMKEDKDGAYAEYELMVRPSVDFMQELLWHGRKITVLKPDSLRIQMIEILEGMKKSYETGEDVVGE